MNAWEQQLLASLTELETAVAQIKCGAKIELLPLFSRIDGLTSEAPRGSDPQLLHYLHKKSYEKARVHLQSGSADVPKGTC